MDIRIMQYYLAVTREGNISAAAESLHVSQPALSRQMKDLEEELGVTLFERGKRKITLTEEGMVLRKRAEEMVRLMQITETEISQVKNKITGDIRIGAGESHVFHYISKTAGILREEYPDIRFHITSGDTIDLMEQLDNGLIDFALIFSNFDGSLYHAIPLPEEDRFGVLMRKDSPLTEKETLSLSDLRDLPLIISRAADKSFFNGTEAANLNIVATYNLIFNASLLVEDGVGYALGFDKLINMSGNSNLCFRPLVPTISTRGTLIWKKYQVFSPAIQLFVDALSDSFKPT
ncbi:MAG: LysR family transcriptional regulator [Acetatifactor sp.]|nr:LysR family transcriptional regulator [Acetatifactor sp.]